MPTPFMPMASYWIVFTHVRSEWIFQSTIFEVIGLPQCSTLSLILGDFQMFGNKIPLF